MKAKQLFLTISIAIFPYLLNAQSVNDIIIQAQQIEASMNDLQAVNKYKEALKLNPSNTYLLCKCSELCSRIAGRLKGNKTKQEDCYTEAKIYAKTALQLNPLNSEANFVMALVMGRDAIQKGGKEKIEAVKLIKKYADLSIHYNSQNYKAWYILGKWYYEVSNLNYFERTAVKIFYGALPPASIEDALACFEKVKLINPEFILNYLSLAEAYKKKDQENIAKENLMTMFNLPNKIEDDEEIKS